MNLPYIGSLPKNWHCLDLELLDSEQIRLIMHTNGCFSLRKIVAILTHCFA